MPRPALRARALWIGAVLVTLAPHTLAQAEPVPVSDWARETIALPPGFAPDMPSGVEELRFPPGWRDPASDNFWSYALVLRIDEPAPTTARLEQLIDVYYTGLMGAFGVGQEPGSLANGVEVLLEPATDHRHRGTLRLVDGFATFEPILIHLEVDARVRSDHASTLELRVSPQPREHGIWSALQAAIDGVHAERFAEALAPLAHLAQGEWRTTPMNGTQQRDVWTWGPSKRALTSVTSNSKATSQATFGSFRVVYYHPQRDELVALALSAPGLIQAGTITPGEDRSLRFDMTLSYDVEALEWAREPTRRISSVWSFDSPTGYTNSWVEDQGRSVDPSMTGWAYARHDEVTPLPPSALAPPEPILHLGAFLPFLESEWKTEATRTTFAWIPYNEAILMRTTDTRADEPIAVTVFYPHPHTKVIHVLTIHDSGAIDEGFASTDNEGISIRAERASRASVARIEQRIGLPSSKGVQIRTWSVQGAERKLLAETTLRASTD